MSHIPLCLVVPFVLACSTGPSQRTVAIQLQGTVTAADDGSPVAEAVLEVRELLCTGSCPTFAREMTDASGDYSLSFVVDPQDFSLSLVVEGCPALFLMVVTHPGFLVANIGGIFNPRGHVACTDELQTLDIQLERIPPG